MVAFSGGKVSLLVIMVYVIASSASLFPVSIPRGVTLTAYAIRTPPVAPGAFARIAIGRFDLVG